MADQCLSLIRDITIASKLTMPRASQTPCRKGFSRLESNGSVDVPTPSRDNRTKMTVAGRTLGEALPQGASDS